jgi:hypothetical protein
MRKTNQCGGASPSAYEWGEIQSFIGLIAAVVPVSLTLLKYVKFDKPMQ